MSRFATIDQRALAPFRKDPGDLVQMLPGRRIVTLGWVIRRLASLAAVFGFLGVFLTIAIGAR